MRYSKATGTWASQRAGFHVKMEYPLQPLVQSCHKDHLRFLICKGNIHGITAESHEIMLERTAFVMWKQIPRPLLSRFLIDPTWLPVALSLVK